MVFSYSDGVHGMHSPHLCAGGRRLRILHGERERWNYTAAAATMLTVPVRIARLEASAIEPSFAVVIFSPLSDAVRN
jgi:hypothetical protein